MVTMKRLYRNIIGKLVVWRAIIILFILAMACRAIKPVIPKSAFENFKSVVMKYK
jgi:hypothetical protein